MTKQEGELKTQIAHLNKETEEAFKEIEDDQSAYNLHAVCIHDGGAEGGHYFIYIKDHATGKWRKFNDMRVDIVEENEVFQNANGGFGHRTAFWVVYID